MLKGFSKGGIHTPEYKISKAEAIADFPLPEIAVVPLSQHIGAPAAACVKKGDAVRVGQVIGTAAGFVSSNIHAPVSGTVVDETDTPVPGASVYAKDRAGMVDAQDVDGKFSLKVQKNDILVVSFLGYAPSETAITGPKSDLRIKLTPSEHQLEEAAACLQPPLPGDLPADRRRPGHGLHGV